MADARITELAPLVASNAQPTVDVLAVADVSTTETKKITLADVVESGIGSVADGSIPGKKIIPGSVTSLEIADGGIEAVDLADNAVTTPKINDGAITPDKIEPDSITASQIATGAIGSIELADNAVTTVAIQDSAVTSAKIENGAVGSDQIANGAVGTAQIDDGSIVAEDLADGAVSTPKIEDAAVTTSKLAPFSVKEPILDNGAVTGVKIADATVTADKLADDLDGSEFLSQPPNFVLAGPASAPNGRPGFRQITSADLPVIAAAKLPIASETQLGVVQIGDGLSASVSGTVRISNVIAPGSGSKVDYDGNGLITASAPLKAEDLPELGADQITSGEFPTERLADNSVTNEKLADYAISFIQEASPPLTDITIGTLWYQESTSGLYMWNGNSFMPISIGRLSQENLRYCGIVDATDGTISGVTTYGTAAGYKIGDALGAATDDHQGVYFVINVAGNGIPETPGLAYDNGDWVLCNGVSAGWERIYTLSSGSGGGGGTSKLEDLLDVSISSAVQGNVLEYQASGQWTNVDTLSGGEY